MGTDMTFNDKHRTFLQVLMHAGVMKDFDFHQAASNIFHYANSALFYKAMMNTKLEPLGMMIMSAQCEFTGEKYWLLANTAVDNVTRFQTQFSQGQMELLRKIFTEIISSMDGSIASTACLNLCTSLETKISIDKAESFLNDCTNRMWLSYKEGHYYMGVRSIIELMPYFRATFDEGFNNCPLCKNTVFHGQRCEGCQVVSHLYCLTKLAQIQNPLKCPACSNVIPSDNLPEVQVQPERPVNQERRHRDRPAGSPGDQKRMKRSSGAHRRHH